MKVLLTGGGTGGHIYPALSVARCLAGDELLYVGTAEGPEAQIVPEHGVPFQPVPSRKLSRRGAPHQLVGALAVNAWGVLAAMGLLRRFRPDVVLGTGGYASAAMMFAAGLLRFPTVIHEANSVPGRANVLLSKLATRIALTYAATESYFPRGKTIVTGMPVREDLLTADPAPARSKYGLHADQPTLLICGGSQGAESLNRAVLEALPELGQSGLQVVHQTGKDKYAKVLEQVGTPPPFYHPFAFEDQMPSLLAASSLVLCRGGSSTLAEVMALGLPAIVVPLASAVGDHQTGNAKALVAEGAAVLVKDAELNGARLLDEVRGILNDPPGFEKMRAASRRLGRPDAARRVADLLREVAGKKR